MNFSKFLIIHSQVINSNENDLRKTLSDEEIKLINNALGLLNDEYNDIREFLYNMFNFGGIVLLLQPFMDGNKRTIIEVYNQALLKRGYLVNFDKILKEHSFFDIIPLFYDMDDKISISNLEKMSPIIENNMEFTQKIRM